MTLLYAVEAWSACWPEMAVHWEAHWAEVATDKTTIPLVVDHASYTALEASGALHVVTVRDDAQGELVGYAIWIIRTHLHYQTTLMAFSDVYYLAPAYRRGSAGMRLFRESEATLRAKGVRKLFTGCKLSLDIGRIFTRLGFTETERLYIKYLGDMPCH